MIELVNTSRTPAQVLYAALLANPQNIISDTDIARLGCLCLFEVLASYSYRLDPGKERPPEIKNRSTIPANKRKDLDNLEEEEYLERKIAATERIADSTERLADTAEAGTASTSIMLCGAKLSCIL